MSKNTNLDDEFNHTEKYVTCEMVHINTKVTVIIFLISFKFMKIIFETRTHTQLVCMCKDTLCIVLQ